MYKVAIKIEEGGYKPTKGSQEAAAYDLYAPEDFRIPPYGSVPIDLKVAMDLDGLAGILTHRSGHNMRLGLTAYGLIDPDYRGNLIVTLHNKLEESIYFKRGDRIAQLRLVEVPEVALSVVTDLNETDRGEGGHGSTGS